MRSPRNDYRAVAVFTMVAACGGAQQPLASGRSPEIAEVPSALRSVPADRTLAAPADVESPASAPPSVASQPPAVQPGAPDVPFVMDVALSARRISHGHSVALPPDGELMKGDRLRFSVRTSQPGYLYIVFCSHRHDPSYQSLPNSGLSRFPKDHGIVMTANVPTIVPAPPAEIVLDNNPGPETLYLILSRSELSPADPALAEAIRIRQPARQTASCGVKLRGALVGPNSHDGTGRNAAVPPTRKTPEPLVTRNPPPEVDTVERGDRGVVIINDGVQAEIVADADDIVVKRFDLNHVRAP